MIPLPSPPENANIRAIATWLDTHTTGGGSGSVPWANITGHPTTVAGYGILDALSESTADARYLRLTGGTLTGTLVANGTITSAAGLTVNTGGTAALTLVGFRSYAVTSASDGTLRFVDTGNTRWYIGTDASWLAGTDNAYDIGGAGHRPRDITAGGIMTAANFVLS